ncbi:MAG: AAA family ATPase [Candidatus Methanoperedens sp.]
MGILLKEIRVRNYHSLEKVNVFLEPLTLLVGQNNYGKTSLLRCLELALGTSNKNFNHDDIFIHKNEVLPNDRKVIIDILIVPVDNDNKQIAAFEGIWKEHLGMMIQQDDKDNEFFAVRTIGEYNFDKNEYEISQFYLTEWKTNPDDIEKSKGKPGLSKKLLEAIPLYFMYAQRDIQEDLKNRSSFWGKLVSDIGLSNKDVEEIEGELSDINEKIIKNSKVLQHLKNSLENLNKSNSNSNINEGVRITPLTRKIRDLNRGMDIHYKDGDAESFSLSNHGMGTRSWATLLTFEAYISWKCNQAKEKNKPFYPILALEEPEAHLHPQAQRHIFEQLNNIMGQKFISTHSPYISSQSPLQSIRHFNKKGESTDVNPINLDTLDAEDIRKLNREVIYTRGELLFARALVLFEGETEDQALPIFAKKYWGRYPFELGISFLSVSGTNYKPFLRIANSLGIEWFILSDGESNTISSLKNTLTNMSIMNDNIFPDNVVILDNDTKFESYLIKEGYSNELNQAILNCRLTNSCNEQHESAIKRDFAPLNNEALLNELSSNKTKYATFIADAIIRSDNKTKIFPSKIQTLLEIVSDKIRIPKAEDN